jgi:hypothetical protein
MSSTTTKTNTVRDNLNSNRLGQAADALGKAPLGDILSVLLDTRNANTTIAATTVGSAVVNTGVTSPAASTYTQADQTALATCVLALVTQINLLRTDVLALRSELATINTAGTVGGATEASVQVSSNKATLAAAPTTNGLITVNGVTGTHTGVKKIIRDSSHTLATGEVYWDGGLNLTFATIDAITVCDVIYAKGDLSQKVSCLLQDQPV